MSPNENILASEIEVSSGPLLSIVLPNRGGVPFIYSAIESILECEDFRFELIINDNSSPDKIDYSKYIMDRRLKLFKEKELLPMSENWLRGLSRTSGKWVCFIGSDDGIVTKQLSTFLDYLETSEFDVVTTRGTYFEYSINGHNPWLLSPEIASTKAITPIRFPSKLVALFPQLRNEMPIPYNFAVVKGAILRNLLEKHSRIPGISPDDFLGQFVAQTCRHGVNYDLPVFIQGNSERSNGRAFALGIDNNSTKDFTRDSLSMQRGLVERYSLTCLPAVSLEHYVVAWEEVHAKVFCVPLLLFRPWCVFSCTDSRHHHTYYFKVTLAVRRVVLKLMSKIVRELWLMKFFGFSKPFRNKKIVLERAATILTASRYLENF